MMWLVFVELKSNGKIQSQSFTVTSNTKVEAECEVLAKILDVMEIGESVGTKGVYELKGVSKS